MRFSGFPTRAVTQTAVEHPLFQTRALGPGVELLTAVQALTQVAVGDTVVRRLGRDFLHLPPGMESVVPRVVGIDFEQGLCQLLQR